MLSIPQNIQNEAKNIIENVFLETCRNLFSETMDNLFYSFSSSKYIELNLNLISKIKKIVVDTIIYAINIIDKLFLNSDYRKKNFYISKQDVPRTIVSIYGTLSFERTYYTDINKMVSFLSMNYSVSNNIKIMIKLLEVY